MRVPSFRDGIRWAPEVGSLPTKKRHSQPDSESYLPNPAILLAASLTRCLAPWVLGKTRIVGKTRIAANIAKLPELIHRAQIKTPALIRRGSLRPPVMTIVRPLRKSDQ